MGDYRSLKAWETAHQITLSVYQATRVFPADELYGLTSQLRRSAASIPANLAEGAGRNSGPEFARYCRIVLGSASELEYHLLLARDLGYMSSDRHAELSERVDHLKRMITRLHHAIRSTDSG
jgi:four helix bundle protein